MSKLDDIWNEAVDKDQFKEQIKALMLELIGTGYGVDNVPHFNEPTMFYIQELRKKVNEL